ncbi:MAG: hypothetical protein HYT80_08525 [Euryarchaeota archaeon]|nr:hypothetical protein [Euryarchaeota archaeon]
MARWGKELGLWAAALAALGWIVAGFAYESGALVIAGFGGVGLGLAAAASGVGQGRPGLALAGALVALVGMVPFALDQFVPFSFSEYYVPLSVYLVGVGTLAGAAVAGLRAAKPPSAVGIIVAGACWAVAGALRTYFDLEGGGYWQLGNAPTLVGGVAMLFGKARTTRAT